MSEVKKVKEEYEEYLRRIKGVTGVGFNSSIIIYVDELTPQLARMLPKTLDGIPVVYIESGKVIPMQLRSIAVARAIYADRTVRYRPAPGGVSVGHPEISAGTLTSRAIDKKDGSIVGLGNDHVVSLDWGELHVGVKGDPTLQPGPHDGGVEDGFGLLKRWEPVRLEVPNLIDGAVFESDQLSDVIKDVGKPSASVDPYVGMKVVGSGRTSGVRYSKIIDVNATMNVEGWGTCTFRDQVVFMPPLLSPGDSGMWIGELDSWRTASVGFAGSTSISLGNNALIFEKLLDVEIIPPLEPISLWKMGGVIGAMFFSGLGLARKPREEVGIVV